MVLFPSAPPSTPYTTSSLNVKDHRATPSELANSAVRRALMEEEMGVGKANSGVAAMSEYQEDRQYSGAQLAASKETRWEREKKEINIHKL